MKNKTNFNNEKGLSGLVLLLIAVAVLYGVFFYFRKISTVDLVVEETLVVEDEMAMDEDSFEELDEDSETPAEIDDSVVEELDNLILEMEEDTDLTDLEY